MTLTLTDAEKAMLNGSDGNARQKAMQLLVRNAEALGAAGDAGIVEVRKSATSRART